MYPFFFFIVYNYQKILFSQLSTDNDKGRFEFLNLSQILCKLNTMKKSTLSWKEMEIVNLGISIAAGCRPCTKYHVKKCREAGLSDAFISDVIERAEQVSIQAIKTLSAKAYETLNCNIRKELLFLAEKDNSTNILIGLAVAYTINSTVLLGEYLNHAIQMKISKEKISEIIAISKFIFYKAKSHVDILSENFDIEIFSNKGGDCSPQCKC